ncbi:MAG: transcriptional regulator [Pseudomonadota bacterium]
MGDNESKVLKAMLDAGEPLRPGDVALATGLDKDAVAKAIKVLKAEGRILSPKRCFWAPAE